MTDSNDRKKLTGLTLDRWEILDRIGEGGMSEVYRARHVIMNKFGAVKFLKADLSQDETAVKRFQQEAMTSGSLAHPNVVQVYDCGASEQGFYLILEFLEGLSLEDLLIERADADEEGIGRLSIDEAIPIFIKVCQGLAHAHSRGIVHRDLKPSNIMILRQNNDVKIVDFGIAKFMMTAGRELNSLTKTGEVFGSPLYMSPEQCRGRQLDGRADIYSLGCLMYEAVTGRKLMAGRNPTEVMLKHVEKKPDLTALESLNHVGAPLLHAIVARCLEKEPESRFADVEELIAALEEVPLTSSSKKTTAARDNQVEQSGFSIMTPLLVLAALVTVLLMGVAVFALWPVPKIPEHQLKLKDPQPLLTYTYRPRLFDARRKKELLEVQPTLDFLRGGVKEPSPENLLKICRLNLNCADIKYADQRYEKAGKDFADVLDDLKKYKDVKIGVDVLDKLDKTVSDGTRLVASERQGNIELSLKANLGAVAAYRAAQRNSQPRDSATDSFNNDMREVLHDAEDALNDVHIEKYGDPIVLNDLLTVFIVHMEDNHELEKARRYLERNLSVEFLQRLADRRRNISSSDLEQDEHANKLEEINKRANLADLYRIAEKFDKEDPYLEPLEYMQNEPQIEKSLLSRLRFRHGLYLLEREKGDYFRQAAAEFERALSGLTGSEKTACASYAYEAKKHYDWFGSLLFRFHNGI
ncbi:MAG: serine/threonine protein kinase [Candidatus Obscuribacter phosphatis]|uniref:non-specific serine/threonine protein kinase n=1 Tax=Candidatus Obscuribacter phosphatis TaxID=1906157 RepID=A0A8J7TMF8_9BACT|nr:serine/threonine protein kinase [Candidatus Obscuribacter phosphatis]